MSFTIVDRRANGKGKSTGNREKFLKRIKEAVKKSVSDIINSQKIKDISSGSGGIVHIPRKSISEPSFRHGQGGTWETVRPGNKEFNTGDTFGKPPKGGSGAGRKGANSGGGEDDFVIELSRDEFLQYFFEDLELPDLVKSNLKEMTQQKWHNAGFTTTGSPAKLDVSKSLRQSSARRMITKNPYKKKLRLVEAELATLDEYIGTFDAVVDREEFVIAMNKREELEKKIEGYKRKIGNVPFLDPVDLRYHSMVAEEVPITSAVMFCVMDNSGSMGEHEKTLSRKFFSLLYMFLSRKYEKITLHFISHTTEAKEVDEEEFFNTRESGGTMVSSALELVNKIIKTNYADGQANIYICQCSDGDNYEADNGTCYELLVDDIMPATQYYAYIQVGAQRGYQSDIWQSYTSVSKEFGNFQMRQVYQADDIYPVFRELFEKKD